MLKSDCKRTIKYTVDPFSFYQNSVTGEWRTLQTTPTVDHTDIQS